jgi:4-hydroxy-tetrahydrodipicolinate synthase
MTRQTAFRGMGTALVTPFKDNGEIDLDVWEYTIDRQINAGIKNLIVLGTTGENPTIEWHEETELISRARDVIGNRATMIVGTGSNCTKHAQDATMKAFNMGADAVMAVTPYYNKPTQQGLKQYYKSVSQFGPTLMYNVPGRTGVNMLPTTAREIADENPNIIGLKEANNKQFAEVGAALNGSVPWFSGDDASNLWAQELGARGCISVTANLYPQVMNDLWEMAERGQISEAEILDEMLRPVHDAMFVESSPVPVKYAMMRHGVLPNAHVREPLINIADESAQAVRKAMDEFAEEFVKGSF